MATNADHLQEVFGIIDLLYKHIGNGRHAPAVALVGGAEVSTAPAASAVNPTPVAVSHTSTTLVAANPARSVLRIYNQGASDMAISPNTAVWANRVIVLSPGDLWEETSAANLAWSAVTASASITTTAGVQEVLK